MDIKTALLIAAKYKNDVNSNLYFECGTSIFQALSLQSFLFIAQH